MILVLACATPTADTAGPTGPTLEGVTYAVTWDATGTTATEAGWSVTNELGWTFEVTAGWVVDRAWQLDPCEDDTGLALAWPLFLGPALAGHGEEDDVSVLSTPVASDLLTATSATLDTVAFEPTAYCSLHVLNAYATSDTSGLPGEPDLVGYTVWLEGTATQGDTTVELAWGTASADGALYDLPDGEGTLGVQVTRSLAGLFEGVDPTEEEPARQLLQSLVDQQVVELTLL